MEINMCCARCQGPLEAVVDSLTLTVLLTPCAPCERQAKTEYLCRALLELGREQREETKP